MQENGSIVPAEEAQPGEFFADKLIQFSPRRVTIAPFGSQTIRLLVRRPRGDIPENVEFRTHLAIRSIPPTPLLQDLESMERITAEGQLNVRAIATIETVIPLLLRLGNPQATIDIANPKLVLKDPQSNYPVLKFDLVRGGQRSVYGELEILHVAPGGQETQLHLAKGLAVYYPSPKRTMTITLKTATARMLGSGRLVIRYVESSEMHGDQSAELDISLGESRVQAQ